MLRNWSKKSLNSFVDKRFEIKYHKNEFHVTISVSKKMRNLVHKLKHKFYICFFNIISSIARKIYEVEHSALYKYIFQTKTIFRIKHVQFHR